MAITCCLFLTFWVVPESWPACLSSHLRSALLSVLFLSIIITGSPSLVQSPQNKLLEEDDSTVKSGVFQVYCWTFPLDPNSKVGDPNKCYLSLRFRSQDHPSSLRSTQNTLLGLVTQKWKCADLRTSKKKSREL